MDDDGVMRPRLMTYPEQLVAISEQLRIYRQWMADHERELRHLADSVTLLQQQHALDDQSGGHLRQQVTQALLTADRAQRTAEGIGRSLDTYRSDVDAELRRWRLLSWGMIVLLAVVLVIVIGVHLA